MESCCKSIATLAIAGALVLGADVAHAVSVNPRGNGQVLLFPYYTVNGGNDTLLSIANMTAHAKAVRVRIAEGENGRDVASINVYLAPYDTWTAAITHLADGNPGLVTTDDTCTVPAISTYAGDPTALGTGSLDFSDLAFTNENADASQDPLATRASEGTIEAIEMGTLVDASISAAAAQRAAAGSAGACNILYNAWALAGEAAGVPDDPSAPLFYWSGDPATDMANPTGGLYGTVYVVNVPRGTIFAYAATALEDFRSDPDDLPPGSVATVVLHAPNFDSHPNLGDALNDPTANIANADVYTNGTVVHATFPAGARGVDAVSAVLTAGMIDSEYTADPSLGATTTYVFSYPTRRFYTDPAIAGAAAIAPFSALFAGVRANTVSETLSYANFDRSGTTLTLDCDPVTCADRLQSPGTSVEVLDLGANASAMLDSHLTIQFAASSDSPVAYSPQGRVQFFPDLSNLDVFWDFNGLRPQRYMRPSNEGDFFSGMPIVGFTAFNIINANAQAGVLANYSMAVPFRTAVACYIVDAGDLAELCP